MPGGRPPKYKKEFAEQARKLCLLGFTDKELADFFCVSEQTVNAWKKKYPKFLESTKEGKNIADAEVAEKLFYRAKGYEHEEDKVFNNGGEIITYRVTKHYPPDTQAASLWLRNRQPKKWRDTQNVNVTHSLEDLVVGEQG